MLSWGNVLCLLLGLALPLGLLLVAFRRGLRPMASASAYRNVAWKLGLDADTRGLSLQGYLHQRRLFVGEVTDLDSPKRSRRVDASLDLVYPLGLGLYVSTRPPSRPWRRGKPSRFTLDDPTLDKVLKIKAWHPERTRPLFTEAVRSGIAQLLHQGAAITITDHWIRLRLATPPTSDTALYGLITTLNRLALALEEARTAIAPSEQLSPHLRDVGALGARLGLVLQPNLPALDGTLEGAHVRLLCNPTPDTVLVDIHVDFPPHAATGLLLQPQEGSDAGMPRRGQDILVGDPAFDDAFIIKGYDPRRIRGLFTDDVREALTDLQTVGDVAMTDGRLSVENLPMDMAVLEHTTRTAARLAAALSW